MPNIINFDSNSVIDMSVMQEIANAVNKHDDLLVSYTNSLSSAVAEIEDIGSIRKIVDFSVNMILYGQEKIEIQGGVSVDGSRISFTTNFASGTKPIVIASVGHGTKGIQYYLSTYSVDNEGFSIKAVRTETGDEFEGSLFINWIAIGNKIG